MAKVIHCSQIFPRCPFVIQGKDETEVLINAAHHWTEEHEVREIERELLRKASEAMLEASAEGSGR
jgi:predicted small metal-binding protein